MLTLLSLSNYSFDLNNIKARRKVTITLYNSMLCVSIFQRSHEIYVFIISLYEH
jgi:hypothetical protein